MNEATKAKPRKYKSRRERGTRAEFVLDNFTLSCLQKIKDLGFSSRKDALRYAIHYVAHEIDKGAIKRGEIEKAEPE